LEERLLLGINIKMGASESIVAVLVSQRGHLDKKFLTGKSKPRVD
jgi:hypothetical protein